MKLSINLPWVFWSMSRIQMGSTIRSVKDALQQNNVNFKSICSVESCDPRECTAEIIFETKEDLMHFRLLYGDTSFLGILLNDNDTTQP